MSIEAVAKRAKVSTATVSRTLNNTAFVDPKTAARVWKAIKELNYYPNVQARGLAQGRSRIIGLIVSDITNPFFPELMKGLEDAAVAHGYEILVSSTNYDSHRMGLSVRRMIERKAEGVAIMTSEMDAPLLEELVHRKVPLVFLDVGIVQQHVSNIRIDYAQGITEAIGHLLDLGHRRIGFISGPLSLKSAVIRRTAFLTALRERQAANNDQLIIEGDHTVDGGLKAMVQLLALEKRPSAILSSNDLTAIGALYAVRKASLRVPSDISVIGFDDIHLAEFTEPPLTTIRLSRIELAQKVFKALLTEINQKAQQSKQSPVSEQILETHLVIRESTGPLNLSR